MSATSVRLAMPFRAEIDTSEIPMMAGLIPQMSCEGLVIKHHHVVPDLRMAIGREFYTPEADYAVLFVDGQLWMSDTLMERQTCEPLLQEARWRSTVLKKPPRFLIAGFGLGMVAVGLSTIMKHRPDAEIVIVEKERRVVDHVARVLQPHLHPGLRIEVADIHDWRPARGERFHHVWLDIWPSLNADNLPEMRTLRKAFRPYLAHTGTIACWSEDEVRALR